jgi:hypothetical protein
MFDDEGYPTHPRDLTRGIYKGGHDPASLFLRVARGMPGTPMPSAPTLTEPQVIDMVHYLRSLSTEEQREAPVLKREKIVARNVTALPTNSDVSVARGLTCPDSPHAAGGDDTVPAAGSGGMMASPYCGWNEDPIRYTCRTDGIVQGCGALELVRAASLFGHGALHAD